METRRAKRQPSEGVLDGDAHVSILRNAESPVQKFLGKDV